MNRADIDLIIAHMNNHACKREDGKEFPNQYPLLAEAMKRRCVPDAKLGLGKYRPIAHDLPDIAEMLGVPNPKRADDELIETTMEHVESVRKDMHKGVRSGLAPAIFMWLWQQDQEYCQNLLARMHFDLQAARAEHEEGGPRLEATGAASFSVFNLQGQIARAQHRLILIAQNHWHMVSPQHGHADRYWPLLLSALERGVDIDIVAMHPDIGPRSVLPPDHLSPPDAVTLWSLFMNTPEFPRQLENCWATLAAWEEDYRNSDYPEGAQLGAFRAYGSYFNPLTFSLVDPEQDDGIIVLSPRTPDPRAASRPQYAIHKGADPEGFNYYWSTVENSLSDHHWVKIVG